MRRSVYSLIGFLLAGSVIGQIVPNTSVYPATATQTVRTVPTGYTGDFNLNIIRVWEPQIPYTNESDVISSSRTTKEVKQSATYFDGLGRPIQTVIKKASHANNSYTNAKDIITPVIYDEFGREAFKYLPYVNGTDGKFKINPFSAEATFMQQTFNPTNNTAGEKFFYSKTEFEASPLNRITKTLAPGNSWVGSARGISMIYEFNEASEVRRWTVSMTQSSIPSSNSYYSANELYRTITTDEHGKRVIEYKDKEGLVLLKKVEISTTVATKTSHTGWLNTYYVYDDFNRLRFVIPPKATEGVISSGSISSNVAHELCFRYEYDDRDRMIIKKVPGSGEVWMVYDERDRLVMSQDANMRASSKWLITQYDGWNRPKKTYMWNNTSNRSTHQTSASTSSSYPTLSGTYDLLTETYFDDYTWVPSGISGIANTLHTGYTSGGQFYTSYNTSPTYAQQVTMTSAVKGMVTGNKVKVLGTSTYLYTVTFYDSNGRIIQTRSSNHKGGYDIVTNQYDFAGKVLRSHNLHSDGAGDISIASKMTYDHAGRLLTIYKNVNGEAEVHVATNSYDELGQLKNKAIGDQIDENGTYTNGTLESLDYSYNIRGWLTGINKNYANETDTIDGGSQKWFGMQLCYDFGFTQNQYNGNIAGIKWKSTGSDRIRAYGFDYDAANRLLKADFTQNTAGSYNNFLGIDFSVGGDEATGGTMKYDANGNILEMWQKGLQINTSPLIDQMTYSYTDDNNEEKGNKLQAVTEDAGIGTTDNKLGDFTDKNTANDDYLYDDNGNLVLDKNKDIESITYNHLNLPHEIVVLDKGTITYTYDAAGNKLKKVTVDNTVSGSKTTTTDYVNGFVYETVDNNSEELQFFGHEEGRIRRVLPRTTEEEEQLGNGIFKMFRFDYFIKDHLGNVRMVLTLEWKQDIYYCSFEDENSQVEEELFNNRTGVVEKPSCFDELEVNKVQKLGAAVEGGEGGEGGASEPSTVIGTGIIIKVMAGDFVNAKVFGAFENTSSNNNPTTGLESILASLFQEGVTVSGGKGNISNVTSSMFEPGILEFLAGQDNYNGNTAYLNWILLDDEQFRYVPEGSGFKSLSDEGGGCEKVLLQSNNGDGFNIPRNGYLYVYVSNTSTNSPVYFDDLHIEHKRGALLEETHYYPFGLVQQGISSKATQFVNPSNKLKYNGKEEQRQEFSDGSGLEWLDYGARMYDNQVGRYFSNDRFAELFVGISTYNYCGNEPINHVDMNGDVVTVSYNRTDDNLQTSVNLTLKKSTNGTYMFYDNDGNAYQANSDQTGFVDRLLAVINVIAGVENEEIKKRLNEIVTNKKVINIGNNGGGHSYLAERDVDGVRQLNWTGLRSGIILSNAGDVENSDFPGVVKSPIHAPGRADADIELVHELLGHGYQYCTDNLTNERITPWEENGKLVSYILKTEADASNIANMYARATNRQGMVQGAYPEQVTGKDGRTRMIHHLIPSGYLINNLPSQNKPYRRSRGTVN